MGLILAAGASLSSVLGDQWKDYFYCSEMPANVLVRKGEHHTGKSGLLNRGGSENIITNGSTVVVNEGQCMIIVDQGAIVDICAEPGAYTYDTSSEPSIFTSGLGKGIKESFKKFAARVAYGGVTAHDQRVYYFNTKNIIGNKYGTASPVPFRVVDRNIGLDLDISIRCFGEYVYKMTDPILFYKNVCGNVDRDYTRDKIEDQLRSELLTALQPAFARISDQGIRYSSLPGHTRELSEALNTELSSTWGRVYGIEIVTCRVSSVKASEEEEQDIKNLQRGGRAGHQEPAARPCGRRQCSHRRWYDSPGKCAGDEGCRKERERRDDGIRRHGHGPAGRRRQCRPAYAAGPGPAAGSSPDAACRRGFCRMDLPFLRTQGKYREVLQQLRLGETG